jgi:hypothetical protein
MLEIRGSGIIIILVVGLLCPGAEPERPALDPARRVKLVELWIAYADSNPKRGDEPVQKQLLEGGEDALEVLIDLLCGPREVTKLAALVEKLASDDFEVREAATREIRSHLPAAEADLARYLTHDDAEVRRRVEDLLGEVKTRRLREVRTRLQGPATRILEVHWPPDQIRRVVKRNLDRLAEVERVEYMWGSRPLAPLLASLRCSPEKEDRDALGRFAQRAKDGAAVAALALMDNGLAGRTEPIAEHWKNVPRHNYTEAALACLNPERPEVFKQAMYVACTTRAIVPRLRDALEKVKDDKLRDEVGFVLLHWHRDARAFEMYFEWLDAEDYGKFETAVFRLTNHKLEYEGARVIPKLRPILRGSNAQRRKLVLGQLDHYLGKEGVTLAADEAVRFLVSDAADERELAEKVLFELQRLGWVDVLQRATEHSDEKIRAAAQPLLAKWKAKKER